jgi:hypothetical protein
MHLQAHLTIVVSGNSYTPKQWDCLWTIAEGIQFQSFHMKTRQRGWEREREDKDLWIKVLTVVVDTLIREMRDLQQWFYQTPFHNPYGWSSLVTSSAPALLHKFCFNMKCFDDLTMKTNWALALVEMEMDQQHTRKTMITIQRHSHEEKPQSTVLPQSCEKCTLASKEGKLRT